MYTNIKVSQIPVRIYWYLYNVSYISSQSQLSQLNYTNMLFNGDSR
jgi:hypothetical protein